MNQTQFSYRYHSIRNNRSGMAMIWFMAVMTIFCFACSFAVDYGHVQLVKTQLQNAVDAAVMAAASEQGNGVTAATNAAIFIAGKNVVDGSPLNLAPNTEIHFISYNTATRTYTELTGTARSTANAMMITCRRAVDLPFT